MVKLERIEVPELTVFVHKGERYVKLSELNARIGYLRRIIDEFQLPQDTGRVGGAAQKVLGDPRVMALMGRGRAALQFFVTDAFGDVEEEAGQ